MTDFAELHRLAAAITAMAPIGPPRPPKDPCSECGRSLLDRRFHEPIPPCEGFHRQASQRSWATATDEEVVWVDRQLRSWARGIAGRRVRRGELRGLAKAFWYNLLRADMRRLVPSRAWQSIPIDDRRAVIASGTAILGGGGVRTPLHYCYPDLEGFRWFDNGVQVFTRAANAWAAKMLGIRLFRCEACGFVAADADDLVNHIASRTRYECLMEARKRQELFRGLAS